VQDEEMVQAAKNAEATDGREVMDHKLRKEDSSMVWNIHYKEKNAKFSGLYDALYDHSVGAHGGHGAGKDGMGAEEGAEEGADGSGGGGSTFLTQGGDNNAENNADGTGDASAAAAANNSQGTVK
jgi:hypothetical protein